MKNIILAVLALALASCGGGGDDSEQTQPPPTETTVTLANVLMRESHVLQGPNVAEHRYGMQSPQYQMPANAVSAEVCVFIEWVQRATGSGVMLTLATTLSRATPSDLQVGDTIETQTSIDYALSMTRCGQLDPTRSDRPELFMRVTAPSAAMGSYTVAVRWNIKAVVR